MGLVRKALFGTAVVGSLYCFAPSKPEVVHYRETKQFEKIHPSAVKPDHANPLELVFEAYDTSNGAFALIRHTKTNRTYVIQEDNNTLFINTLGEVVGRAAGNLKERIEPYFKNDDKRNLEGDVSKWTGGYENGK